MIDNLKNKNKNMINKNLIIWAVLILSIIFAILYSKIDLKSFWVNSVGAEYEILINEIVEIQKIIDEREEKSSEELKITNEHKKDLLDKLSRKKELDEGISWKTITDISFEMDVSEDSTHEEIVEEYCLKTKLTDIKNPIIPMDLVKNMNPEMTLEEIRCEFKKVNSNIY